MSRIAGMTLVLFVVSLVSGLTAQSREDADRRFRAAQHRIHELRAEADAWEKKGWETRAAETRKKAEIMERELRVWRVRLERDRANKEKQGHKQGGQSVDRIVSGLEAGARALRELGRIEQAKEMEELAKVVARRRVERPAENDKRALAKRYLDYLRFAVVALVEADQRASAERVEQVMHAIELSLEGRNDEEANRIRRDVPKAELLLDDLERAIRVLRKQGKKDKAEAVLEVFRQMAKNEKAQGRKDRQEEERADEEDEEEAEEEEVQERLEELEKRMKKLERYLKELNRTIKESRR